MCLSGINSDFLSIVHVCVKKVVTDRVEFVYTRVHCMYIITKLLYVIDSLSRKGL